RPVIPRGATAMADALPRPAGGGAARFSTGGRDLTIVTEVAGADFAATLDALVDRDLLAAFDGRVMRWTPDGADVQDRGPWRAPAIVLADVAPPTRRELARTLLFLTVIGGLSLAWIM